MKENLHRADVVAALHKQGRSLAELERANRMADGSLRSALTYPRTPSNKIIAKALGKTLHELWPTWFDEHGRLTAPARKRRRKTSRTSRTPSSQKRAQKLNLTGRDHERSPQQNGTRNGGRS